MVKFSAFCVLNVGCLLCQPLYTFEIYDSGPPKRINDTGDENNPNIVYWNETIKNFGLSLREFDTFSLPVELFSYGSTVESEYQNCIMQWNQNGCLELDENSLYGVGATFSSDPELFDESTTEYGGTIFAVTKPDSKYQFEIYPTTSLLDP
jgi:hypothetical protein